MERLLAKFVGPADERLSARCNVPATISPDVYHKVMHFGSPSELATILNVNLKGALPTKSEALQVVKAVCLSLEAQQLIFYPPSIVKEIWLHGRVPSSIYQKMNATKVGIVACIAFYLPILLQNNRNIQQFTFKVTLYYF